MWLQLSAIWTCLCGVGGGSLPTWAMGWTCSGAPGYKSYCNFQGTQAMEKGMTRSGVGDSRTSPTSSPERGKLGTRREVHMVTPEKRIQSPKTPPAPKTVPRSNILHDMAVRAQPVMWEVERQDRKRRKFGSHSRQGTFDEDGGVTKRCGCRGTSGYLQLGSGLGSRRARASTVGPSESCPAPSVSKAIEIA